MKISPGLIFVQKAVLLGLFSRELIFGEAYYWKEFCISKWVGLDNKNSLKQLAIVNNPWPYVREGFFLGGKVGLGGLLLENFYGILGSIHKTFKSCSN